MVRSYVGDVGPKGASQSCCAKVGAPFNVEFYAFFITQLITTGGRTVTIFNPQ